MEHLKEHISNAKLEKFNKFHEELSKLYTERAPESDELAFFRSRPEVAGYAADDNKVVINPFSSLSSEELDAVRRNERVRLFLDETKHDLTFNVEQHQHDFLQGTEYSGQTKELRQTIIGRILSGDDTLSPYSVDQRNAATNVIDSYFKTR